MAILARIIIAWTRFVYLFVTQARENGAVSGRKRCKTAKYGEI
jgi:hypothetical protein